MMRLVSPTPTSGASFGIRVHVSDEFLAITGSGQLPAAYVSRSDPSKVHSLATANGGVPRKIFAFQGALLVETGSQLVWFKRQRLMPFKVATLHIFQHHVQSDSVRCAKANRDKNLRAYFARWTVSPYG